MSSDVVNGHQQSVPRKSSKPLYKDLSLQILVAMLLGVAVGWVWPDFADALKPLGDLFIRLVRMIVAPIIFCTVVHGIASVGEAQARRPRRGQGADLFRDRHDDRARPRRWCWSTAGRRAPA